MATIDKNFIPPVAVHPTEIIKDEMLARSLKQKELAERLGMKAPNLTTLLRNKQTITPALANKLADALDIPSDFWLSMQAQYERDCRAIESREVDKAKATMQERLLSQELNMTALFKALCVTPVSGAIERMRKLWDIFGIDNPTDLLLRCEAVGLYKKSDKCSEDRKNLNTWLLLADLACGRASSSNPYVEGNAQLAGAEIADVANSKDFSEQKIKDILYKYGIGYSVVPKLDKVPVDGYSRYTDRPCIVVTHRYDDLYKLAFVVLHELGHIHLHLEHDRSNAFVNSLTETETQTGEQEEQANKFARDTLINMETWNKIIGSASKNMQAKTISQTIQRQAEKYGINKYIALYRFQYETGMYRLPRPKAVPI